MIAKMRVFALGTVAAAALVMALTGTGHALGNGNPVPTSAICYCAGGSPLCSAGPLIVPGKNQVFELTDVTEAVIGSAVVTLQDDSSPKMAYSASGNFSAPTVMQSFQTYPIFTTNLTVQCTNSAGTFASVAVSGLLVTQPWDQK
jgi:hypothetical protein